MIKNLFNKKAQQVKVKKLAKNAVMPTFGTAGAACFDLYAVNSVGGKRGIVSTGLAFEIPQGFVMLIYGRSGNAFNGGWRLGNCVGVIDSDYRGEVKVLLQTDKMPLSVKSGDRIAQAMIVELPSVQLVESTELSDTERGAGGFGSTGK